ncbi:MAG: hypothetical protein HQL49_12830 [Gammaproteobacteria bacterium]|nr:hypothetical protein [Gammaproteobacteria bacterium]
MTTLLIVTVTLIALYYWYRRARRQRQSRVIDSYRFHPAIINKFREVRPNLKPEQEEMVFNTLRDYFHLCHLVNGRRMIAMPSQVVDDAWHAFILHTRAYDKFCHDVFGRFLHHTPAQAMMAPQKAQQGIKRAWTLICQREEINPQTPHRIPKLFAIDRELAIPGGFYYVMDCGTPQRRHDGSYCASHIGCGSGCTGDSSSGSGCGGDSSGDSGCGGGGCGGGGD